MGYSDALIEKTTRWEVACVASFGGAYVGGVAAFLFSFRNPAPAMKVTGRPVPMFLIVGGLGLGGWGAGVVSPDLRKGGIDYTRIGGRRPYSMYDLNCTLGRVSIETVGFVVGYSAMWISAYGWNGVIFESQRISGPSLVSPSGATLSRPSMGILAGVGMWKQWACTDEELREKANRVLKGTPYTTFTQG